MRIRPDGGLEIQIAKPGNPRWCLICPRPNRYNVIWSTHSLAHSGVHRTTNRITLSWYWPGLTADVRRLVKSCEKCQVAKHGRNHASKSRQYLHTGRPWQKVAIDLVGPMPRTRKGNKWILVLTDHFTRWQDALAITEATTPVIANMLDERVFSYLGLPESIHSDQGAQFESCLMKELCALWNIDHSRTTPYHPQGNGVVERLNRGLGDSLRTLLLDKGVDEWDTLLPQLMRAFRGTPSATTGETANLMMLGRETRLPDQLQNPPQAEKHTTNEYTQDLLERMNFTHNLLQERQEKIHSESSEEPLLFNKGDLVLMVNKRRRKGENPKLQPKFVGPYEVLECYNNHTYKISGHNQETVQNENRLKLYTPCQEPAGRAPSSSEPALRPNMKGMVSSRNKRPKDQQTETADITSQKESQFKDKNAPETAELEDKYYKLLETFKKSFIQDSETEKSDKIAKRGVIDISNDNSEPLPSDRLVEDNSELGGQRDSKEENSGSTTMSTQDNSTELERPMRNRKPPERFSETYCHLIEEKRNPEKQRKLFEKEETDLVKDCCRQMAVGWRLSTQGSAGGADRESLCLDAAEAISRTLSTTATRHTMESKANAMGEELNEMDMLDRLLQDLEKQEDRPKLALTKIARKEDVPHSSVQEFHNRTEPDNVLHIHENEDDLQESDDNISWDQDRPGYVEEPELSTPKKVSHYTSDELTRKEIGGVLPSSPPLEKLTENGGVLQSSPPPRELQKTASDNKGYSNEKPTPLTTQLKWPKKQLSSHVSKRENITPVKGDTAVEKHKDDIVAKARDNRGRLVVAPGCRVMLNQIQLPDEEPVTEKWITRETRRLIEECLGPNLTCLLCRFQGVNQKRLRVHCRQHYTLHICSCQYRSPSRDTVSKHLKDCSLQKNNIYEVDVNSYEAFCKKMKWLQPRPFGACKPYLTGESSVFKRLGPRIPKKPPTSPEKKNGKRKRDAYTPPSSIPLANKAVHQPRVPSQEREDKCKRYDYYLEKARNLESKSFKLQQEADYYRQKAKLLRSGQN